MRKILAMQETEHEVFEQPENPTSYKITVRIRGRRSHSKLHFVPSENIENAMTRNVLNNLVIHSRPGT